VRSKPITRIFSRQSALLAPLNKVLGTETNVRIIRALDQLRVPISVSELARYIEMDRAGVWRAVTALEELGVIESVGIGKQSLRLRKEYPLNRYLADLFRAERNRFKKILQALTEVAVTLKPAPKSVWIEGPVTTGRDELRDPLVVGLLATSSDVGRLADDFSRRITHIQKQFDIAIEVRGLTIADLSVMDAQTLLPLADVILVAGVPPSAFTLERGLGGELRPSLPTLHKHREDQSLLLARALSEKIRRDPSIIRRASAYLKERLENASPREAKELHEWRRVLQTYSIPRLRRFLTDGSERGIRLRQSSPFFGALSPRERAELLKDIANEGTTSLRVNDLRTA
jgi:DNA-binding transcriptional ArsR family regulator